QKPDMSILVSTAYMDEAEHFEWLVAMNDGRILATGTATELKHQTGTSDLEKAFIALLPESERGNQTDFIIPPRPITDGDQAITAKGLTQKFGDFTAVDKVDFTIKTGEIFGFLGSNGCGKTTTMKMLTGLLTPTEGEVFLWGEPIETKSLDTRRRIGFMSQSFSLYSEMSVEQNLFLHARLFHLHNSQQQQRIAELVERFKLKHHLQELAGQLPLGIRQRLSLAVALIHKPEILILDEPTSGVDPIARDEFWRTLVELSREDNVTIFISTHFMNEALRCDRISLMHAGKVLAQGSPNQLISDKQAPDLETAFIRYMEDAMASSPSEEMILESDDSKIPAEASSPPRKTSQRFSLRRLFAYSHRETLELLRDPVRLSFAFIGSILLLLVFTYGITTDVEKIKFSALDLDQTPASRNYLKSFEGSSYFKEMPPLKSKTDMDNRLVSRAIEVAIEIPPGFGKNLKSGKNVTVSAWVDGANTFRAGTVTGYVSGAHAAYLSKQTPSGAALMQIQSRFKYNPAMENIYAMAPSMPALLLILFPAILMAVSVAREKEMGTITNFYVTPTSRLEFVIGKQLPYIAVGFINLLMLLLFVIFVMNVPVKGSIAALILGGTLYVAATTGLGLLLSSLVRTQVAAVFVTAVLTMMPTMQFSGMLQPVSTLEETGRIIGSFWPTTYFMHLSVASFTKGLTFEELSGDLWALLAFLPVLVGLSAFLLKKQEA
ncbi:MAG: ribosome-associated ATPase/putative transporter RbbA, partial [Hydrogenovibrio sp.]|nr:ribosome-associated ATPase/putative transporter RbbA [Hydrogenovibrio sp.]